MNDRSNVIDFVGRFANVPNRIEYAQSDGLPKLGWFATLDFTAARLTVLHGKAVECRPEWMVEGVWDGPFVDGGFHRGAHLFGSGIRLDGCCAYFMPSCALVDRLFYCRDAGKLLVSNSLVILLAATGARLDARHDYLPDAKAIQGGIDGYDTSFHVVHPSIRSFHQVYHKAIVVQGGSLALQRTIPIRDFTDFEDYRRTLRARLAALCANGADATRRTPLATYGTLSTGYDSTAVTTLVKEFGVRQYFTYVGAWSAKTQGQAEYETAPIAAALGVETIRIETPPAPAPEDELLLRAASPLGQQLPLIAMARNIEERASAALVFTGFHGDIIWDVNVPESFVSEGIIRHDISGLDLSELRLKSGFFNVAAPFLYAASIKSIVTISRSSEMEPWRLGTQYDRPISRRIVEQAGVRRDQFGFLKGGIFGGSLQPRNPLLRARYFAYLRAELGIPLPMLYARIGFDRYTARAIAKAAQLVRHRLRSPRLAAAIVGQLRKFQEGYSWYGRRNLRGTLYAWAVMELTRRLAERGTIVRAMGQLRTSARETAPGANAS